MEKVDLNYEQEIIDFMKGKKETDLIEVLHKVQGLYGYIPRPVVTLISKTLDVPVSKIYGVMTFYTAFTLVPKGEYAISVCMGTACYVKNADKVLQAFSDELGIEIGGTTEDLLFSIIETRCLGDCAVAPIVMVNDKVYEYVTVEDVPKILADITND